MPASQLPSTTFQGVQQPDLFGQGTTVAFEPPRMGPPRIQFCTSNVAGFKIGGE